jgi:hypothetical protein
MQVRLNKARQNGAPGSVNHNVSRLARFSKTRDPAVANKQIPAHDGVLAVHR